MKMTAEVHFKCERRNSDLDVLAEKRVTAQKEIDIPAAPVGLRVLTVRVGDRQVECAVYSTGWSEPTGKYVIVAAADYLDFELLPILESDQNWAKVATAE